uniref:Chitin-binding type-2 domain-containing protein n=1 Tax=Biomphalaria glabrata TaxID=6526 RepID=A0A2C9K346_BIOGL
MFNKLSIRRSSHITLHFFSDQLLQCPTNSYRSGTTCVCTSAYYTYNSGSNTCDLQCPSNSYRSGSTCVCSSPYTYNSGSNICDLQCPTNAYRSGTSCVCNSPYTYNSVTNNCDCQIQCPSNAYRSGTCSCTCNSSTFVYNSTSNTCEVQCPMNSYRSGNTCVCNSPYTYMSGTNTCDCPTQCPSNAYRSGTCSCTCYSSSNVYNSVTNTCETSLQCPANSYRSGNTCICTSAFYTFNSGTNTCDLQCPTNAYKSGSTCVCNSPYKYNSGSNTCDCPSQCPSNAYRSGTCSCTCYSSSNFYNSVTNTCETSLECPANSYRSGNTCICTSAFDTYNSGTNTCDRQCPTNAIRSGNNCQCNSPYTYNSVSNTCDCPTQCPSNAYRSGTCSCTCYSSSNVYNSVTNTCETSLQCPVNSYRSGNTCICTSAFYTYKSGTNTCDLQCPTNAYRTGTTCVCTLPFYAYISGSNTCELQCPVGALRSGATCVCNSPNNYNSILNICERGPFECTLSCVQPQKPDITCTFCECPTQCPANAYRSGTCDCICSTPSYVYNSFTNTCDLTIQCPANAYRSGNTCVCNYPYSFNSISNTCESSTTPSTCAVTCPSGSILNTDCTCRCAVGYEFNQTVNQCVPVPKYNVCQASEYSCENNQVAYKDCHGKCFCACSSGFAGPRCEIVVRANLCDNCFYDNGHYHAGVANHCDLYVNCIPNGIILRNNSRPDSFTPYVMSCPPGTYYITRPDGWKGCDFLTNGICSADKCQSLQPNAKYADQNACQSYWQCGDNRKLLSKGCCEAGQAFDERSQSCVTSSSCQVSCGSQVSTGCNMTTATPASTCPFAVTPTDPNEYFYKDVSWAKLRCLPNNIMNLTLCRCVAGYPDSVSGCDPSVNNNFETNPNSEEDSVPRIQVSGVGQVANFSGNQDLVLKMFAGSGFYTNYFQINLKLYLPNVPTGAQRMAVVTNADCSRRESVSITVDNKNFYFQIYQLESNSSVEINIPYSGLADNKGWYDITLIYQKIQNTFELSGRVGSVTQKYQGNINLTAYIDTRNCALHLGYGFNYNSLIGYVDNFQVWRCNPNNSQ